MFLLDVYSCGLQSDVQRGEAMEILHLCSVVKSMDKSHVFFANCSQYGLCLPARQIVWECAFLMVLGLELFRKRRHANRLRDLGHIAAKLIENVRIQHMAYQRSRSRCG